MTSFCCHYDIGFLGIYWIQLFISPYDVGSKIYIYYWLMFTAATNGLKSVHVLQDSELQVKCFDHGLEESSDSVANTTQKVNLPQRCTEDLVQPHVEDPEFGGHSGAVKAVKMIGSENARVEFTNTSGKLMNSLISMQRWSTVTPPP